VYDRQMMNVGAWDEKDLGHKYAGFDWDLAEMTFDEMLAVAALPAAAGAVAAAVVVVAAAAAGLVEITGKAVGAPDLDEHILKFVTDDEQLVEVFVLSVQELRKYC
jgi:hypothetical protein